MFDTMDRDAGMAGVLTAMSGRQLLVLAVERLLGKVPAELTEPQALDRLRTLIVCGEQLHAARLAAVRDADLRQLHILDAAGSTRGWLRNQLGGEDGQLSCARRLALRPRVQEALAGGQVSVRGASQLCAVLNKVPAQVDEALLRAVLVDGVGGLLQLYTGGLVLDDAVTPDLPGRESRGRAGPGRLLRRHPVRPGGPARAGHGPARPPALTRTARTGAAPAGRGAAARRQRRRRQ